MRLFLGIVITAWLVIGVAAAGQRGYYGNDQAVSCKTGADLGLTMLAGPLNYLGVNPKLQCTGRHPSL